MREYKRPGVIRASGVAPLGSAHRRSIIGAGLEVGPAPCLLIEPSAAVQQHRVRTHQASLCVHTCAPTHPSLRSSSCARTAVLVLGPVCTGS